MEDWRGKEVTDELAGDEAELKWNGGPFGAREKSAEGFEAGFGSEEGADSGVDGGDADEVDKSEAVGEGDLRVARGKRGAESLEGGQGSIGFAG